MRSNLYSALKILTVALLTSTTAFAGKERGGGHVVLSEDLRTVKGFIDTLELPRSARFLPSALLPYKNLLNPQLKILKTISPRLSVYLDQILSRPINPRWILVPYHLPDEPVQYDRFFRVKKQLLDEGAIATSELILINKHYFDQLGDKDLEWCEEEGLAVEACPHEHQAGLLLHEALRFAFDLEMPEASISKLVSIILDPYLEDMPAEQVRREIRTYLLEGEIQVDGVPREWKREQVIVGYEERDKYDGTPDDVLRERWSTWGFVRTVNYGIYGASSERTVLEDYEIDRLLADRIEREPIYVDVHNHYILGETESYHDPEIGLKLFAYDLTYPEIETPEGEFFSFDGFQTDRKGAYEVVLQACNSFLRTTLPLFDESEREGYTCDEPVCDLKICGTKVIKVGG